MTYRLVFDVSNTPILTWGFVANGAVMICAGAFLVFAPALSRKLLPAGPQGKARVVFAWCFFLYALISTLGSALSSYNNHQLLSEIATSNRCTLVSGKVEKFVPMPYSGHARESFEVNGVTFRYSDYWITGGFNKTASHGGPILEGLSVRICYVARTGDLGNIILRLETETSTVQ